MESQAKQVENVNTFRTLSHHGFQTVTQKHTDLSSIPHVACFTSTRQAIKQTFDNQTYTIPCNAWVSMLGAWLCSACCCVPGPLNALVLTWIHNFYVCFRYPKPAKLACKQTCKEENNQTSKAPLAGPLFFVLCLISFLIGWLVFLFVLLCVFDINLSSFKQHCGVAVLGAVARLLRAPFHNCVAFVIIIRCTSNRAVYAGTFPVQATLTIHCTVACIIRSHQDAWHYSHGTWRF